jgi:hypothetical protein
VLVWGKLTEQPYSIPDDARSQLFWMQRFIDSALFQGDWIADYFQSVSPVGLSGVYRGVALLGVSPLAFSKVLPSVLILLTAIAAFLTGLELSALPAAGFAASVLLHQSPGFTSAIASGTSKAFVYFTCLGFLYGWLRRSPWLVGLFIILQGLFSPQTVLISVGVLVLGLIERQPSGKWRVLRDRQLWQVSGVGLAIATAVVAQYALASSQFGPKVTLKQALEMPEFYNGGRNKFFSTSVTDYLLSERSGLRLDSVFTPMTNLLAIVLPGLMQFPRNFPLGRVVRPTWGVLWKLPLVCVFWFWVCHQLLFMLHLPSRYTGRYFLLTAVLSAGIAMVMLTDGLIRWAFRENQTVMSTNPDPTAVMMPRSPVLTAPHTRTSNCPPPSPTQPSTPRSLGQVTLVSSGILALWMLLLLYPLTYGNYPKTFLTEGTAARLYEFFAAQPKASLVTGLSPEINNLPSFSGRSILVGAETAIPYHLGFYGEIETRAKALVEAQYSPDPEVLRAFIQRYGITHWVLDPYSFDAATVRQNSWIRQYQPETDTAIATLLQGHTPALVKQSDRCILFADPDYRVVDAQCLLQ